MILADEEMRNAIRETMNLVDCLQGRCCVDAKYLAEEDGMVEE